MFTGVITAVGRLEARREIEGGANLVVSAPAFTDELALGESIAVCGVCLTVVAARGAQFEVQAIRETLARTTLGGIPPGGAVNLERALRPSDRIGGHFVTGHVDASPRVLDVVPRGAECLLWIEIPDGYAAHLVEKGSVALDGVSLTIAEVRDADFVVCLIPFTREHTTLGGLSAGDRVNLETDLLGKHVARFLTLDGADSPAWRGGRGPVGGSLR